MSDNKRTVVRSWEAEDGGIVIEYSDGTKETMYSMSEKDKTTALTVVGGSKTTGKKGSKGSSSSLTTRSTSTRHASGGYSSGSDWDDSGYYYAGGSSGYYKKPTLAFTVEGIQFWGCAKSKLDDILFEETDLIVNCTGTKWSPKAPPVPKIFAKETPNWMNLPEVLLSPTTPHNYGERASQLLLDWPDMKTPPDECDLDFWSAIIDQAKANDITRVIVCCTAGQGRTGTALSAFLLASGAMDEPDLAIDYIRENYNDKAVETKSQAEYIFNLIYEPVEDEST